MTIQEQVKEVVKKIKFFRRLKFFQFKKENKLKKEYLDKSCGNCGNILYIVDSIICSKCNRNYKKELIKEFLNDFIWYMAFELHYKWFQWRRCLCKITPFQFRDWILEKWKKMRLEY